MWMTCGQARQAVKASGYYNVVTLDCSGKIYNFSALRNGKKRYVSVNAKTGAVVWDHTTADHALGYEYTSGPIVAKGKIVSGMTGCTRYSRTRFR